MLAAALRIRRGVTLVELMVTLVVGGIALSLIAAVSVRQQRVVGDLADGAAQSGQLAEAAAILPIDLSSLASGSGDIREARDTSIEIRATIASAVICDTIAGGIVLSPVGSAARTYGSILTSLSAGDTAWVLLPDDSTEGWTPRQIVANAPARTTTCSASAPWLSDSARLLPRLALSLDGPALAGSVGMTARVTRPLRYSLYRGSDGLWYLGQRDWNAAAARFNTIQPVSGPFLSPALHGLVFQYLDSGGHSLATPVADTKAVSMIRVDLRSQTRQVVRALSSAQAVGKRTDSVSVWVLLRNRR